MIGFQEQVGEPPVEFDVGLCNEPRFRAGHASVHGDGAQEMSGRPAQIRSADREQARLAVGDAHLDAAAVARYVLVVVLAAAKVALANVHLDQPRKLEANAHRTRVARMFRPGERDAAHDRLQQEYVYAAGGHRRVAVEFRYVKILKTILDFGSFSRRRWCEPKARGLV